MFTEIMKLVKKRAKYINKVGGSSEANVESISDIITEIGYVSEEINQFADIKEDETGELRKLMIEAAASIVCMVGIADKNRLWESENWDASDEFLKKMFINKSNSDLYGSPPGFNTGLKMEKQLTPLLMGRL